MLIVIPSEFKPIVIVSSAYPNSGGLTVTVFGDWAPERTQSVLALTEQSSLRRDHVRWDVLQQSLVSSKTVFERKIEDAGAKKSA